jgi:septum formation protein
MRPLILASSSPIRAELLRRAGLVFQVVPARVDEVALRDGLLAEGATPRDIADAVAEFKAQRVALRQGGALVLGCDQVLELDGQVLGKPENLQAARDRLLLLRGRSHRLFSAAVLYEGDRPIWRHVSEARLTMRLFSHDFLDWYLEMAGPDILQTVGGYAVESLGVRLFDRIDGDQFGILGLPLVELLATLSRRGDITA